MRVDVVTIFPNLFTAVLDCGIVRRALESRIVDIRIVNLRDFTTDNHKTVDDRPYGGGEGMILMPGPLFDAVEFCRGAEENAASHVVLLSPQGERWSQKMAEQFSGLDHIVMICGRYEGVDQRVVDHLVDREVSIGDFILTGGEIPAMVILDSVVRLLPGAVGCRESVVNESFSTGLLDYPQYTRPAEFRGMQVPEILRTGNHAEIKRWRRAQALEKTAKRRPELLNGR